MWTFGSRRLCPNSAARFTNVIELKEPCSSCARARHFAAASCRGTHFSTRLLGIAQLDPAPRILADYPLRRGAHLEHPAGSQTSIGISLMRIKNNLRKNLLPY